MKKAKITAGWVAGILLALIVDFTYKRLHDSGWSVQANLNSIESDNQTAWLKDWHNNEVIDAALNTQGLGEVGKSANIEEYSKELYNKYGFDALLSDAISLQRTVPDWRPKACWNISYIAELPRTSIVIIFHNERLSVLLRTVYSILNRTPVELLEEVILVDDGSTWPNIHDNLEQQIRLNFPPETTKVQLIRQSKRTGIMGARMMGARRASKRAEVLIFLDSHFEVGYNWLPPLLEPIAIDPKTCTCPIIDRIAYDSFEYTPMTPWRGYFDYRLNYNMLPLNRKEHQDPTKNFKNYVMMGGAMAISSDFFWQLGGFDEGMTLYGGEQFEMSFKIWMCGGQLLDVPCSRMGHLFRDDKTQGNRIIYGDLYQFILRNTRRVLDIWVEPENRHYFFGRRPELKTVDAGNLTAQRLVRQRLKCKSFSWMIENVMPDLHDKFLPVEPADLGAGLIRSVHHPNYCFTYGNDSKATLAQCPADNANIEAHQNWQYTWHGQLRIFGGRCMESDLNGMTVGSFNCHDSGGNQKWYYDRNMQWIRKLNEQLCVLANIEEQRIQLANCDVENLNLKWIFSHVNQTEMERFDEKLKHF